MKYAIVQTAWYEPMELNGIMMPGIGHHAFMINSYYDTLEEAEEKCKYLNQDRYADYIIIQVWGN